MTVSQVNTFTVFVHKARASRPGRLGSRRASAGSGRPRRGGAAAARRRRPACGLRSRSTCRRARCSSCPCTPSCFTISTWINIPALAHGVVRQHGKAIRELRAAVRRRAVAARRADAFAAKQRAACVEEQPFSHQLAAWRSAALSFVMASCSACTCTCCTLGMGVEDFDACCRPAAIAPRTPAPG